MSSNVTFDEINIGDTSSYNRTVTQSDIKGFADVSGDDNPIHLSEEFAKQTQFGSTIAHGMLTASYISTILGTQYPGQGTIFMGINNLRFLGAVKPGDTLTTTLTVASKHASKPVVTFDCETVNQNGNRVLTAEATVKAPTQKITSKHNQKPSI